MEKLIELIVCYIILFVMVCICIAFGAPPEDSFPTFVFLCVVVTIDSTCINTQKQKVKAKNEIQTSVVKTEGNLSESCKNKFNNMANLLPCTIDNIDNIDKDSVVTPYESNSLDKTKRENPPMYISTQDVGTQILNKKGIPSENGVIVGWLVEGKEILTDWGGNIYSEDTETYTGDVLNLKTLKLTKYEEILPKSHIVNQEYLLLDNKTPEKLTYIIRCLEHRRIKIGVTNHGRLNKRLRELENAGGITVEVIYTFNKNIEKFLHQKFSKYRAKGKGEWFNDDDSEIENFALSCKEGGSYNYSSQPC